MRVDLDTRLTVAFIFGLVGLAVELVAGLLGAPVNQGLTATLGGIVLGTFGVGIVQGSKRNGE